MRPLIAIVAAALLADVGAGCSSGNGGHPTTTPTVTSQPTSSAPASTFQAPELPPSTPRTVSSVQRLQQWYAAVSGHFQSIQQDTELIKAAAGQSNVSALPQLCGKLHDDVVQVASDPKPPDNRLAVAVGAAMDAYRDAATSCLNGDYGVTADAINKGGLYLAKANAIIDSVNR